MNFPDTSLATFLYWIINTPGVGGVAVGLLGAGIFLSVGLTLRWIARGGRVAEPEEYVHPTPTLLGHDE